MVAIAVGIVACDTAQQADRARATADSPQVRTPTAVVDTPTQPAEPPVDELRHALQQLLRGSGEHRGSEHSWFSPVTAGALRSVTVDSAGHATVNFEDLRALIPNASSSAGSALLLHELNATVFGVAGIRSVDYLIEGSCDRFWEWLQYSCHTVDRP